MVPLSTLYLLNPVNNKRFAPVSQGTESFSIIGYVRSNPIPAQLGQPAYFFFHIVDRNPVFIFLSIYNQALHIPYRPN